MQRIVSGEGIHGLEATSDLPRNDSEHSGVMMSHSPSVAFGDVANFVEHDGGYHAEDDGGGMTDADDTIATFTSRSSMNGARLDQQEGNGLSSQRQTIVSPPIPINAASQQQQQTPLSIISGLVPALGLLPISRNDSRNSRNSGTTTSFGSGLQRSQNSSRDWGWFEDVHHSDQSVNGTSASTTRTGRNSRNEGTTSSSGTNRTSLPQHQLSNTRAGNLVHSDGIGNNGNRGAGAEGSNIRMGGNGDDGNHAARGGGDGARNNRNSNANQLRVRGRGDTNRNTVSLLPTGDEMLVDESQEYLEPIPMPKPVDMENGKGSITF